MPKPQIRSGDQDYQTRAASAGRYENPRPELIKISYQGVVDAKKREWDAPKELKPALRTRFPEGPWRQKYILTLETPATEFDKHGRPIQNKEDLRDISLSFRKMDIDPQNPIELAIKLAAVESVANIYQVSRYSPHPNTDRIAQEYGLIPKDETSVLFEGTLTCEIGTPNMQFRLRQDTLANLPEDLQKTTLDRQSRHAQAYLPALPAIVEHATAPSENLLPRIPVQQTEI